MSPHRPRAFRMPQQASAEREAPRAGAPENGISPDTSLEALLEAEGEADALPAVIAPPPRRRRLIGLGGLLASALGGLIILGLATAAERFVVSLFAENAWLGSVALALALLAGLALLGLLLRELVAIWRQRHILALRRRAEALRRGRDVAGAGAFVAELAALYARRPDTARARALLAGLERDVIDPGDRIDVAERELIGPLDAEARHLVAAAAQRVSIVTALAPRAIFDVLFVAGQSIWLIRRVAEIYGSRPGFIGFLALAKRVITHLALTGGMAAGDSIVQQVLGHGIASRLSARLGEGVLNGLLTARVGLAAIAASRPLPFVALAEPKLKDVAGALLRRKEKEAEPGPES